MSNDVRSPLEVFRVFLALGFTSFGGPVAHIGYFRTAFVEQRQWLSESQFAQLLAVCQLLPGPASSQLGFGIGLLRAGWMGAIAAFLAFTTPSVLALLLFALYLPEGPVTSYVVDGLKLVAVVVVADAVRGMLGNFCPDPRRATIAALAAVAVLLGPPWTQLGVILFGAIAGGVLVSGLGSGDAFSLNVPYGNRLGVTLLVIFGVLFLALPLAAGSSTWLAIADTFYRAGSLVFGGGHVVLPLLQEAVVVDGSVDASRFIAGYGAAQAVPGPMFSFAAFLGAAWGEQPVLFSLVAVAAVFLPGFLLLGGLLPLWSRFNALPKAQEIVAGINAAVVGLLAATLYDPVFVTAVTSVIDLAIAITGFLLLVSWRLSALYVVVFCVPARVAVGFAGL